MSCPERAPVLRSTLASLAAGGWPEPPEVVMDDQDGPPSMERCNGTWRRLIERAGKARSDFVLLCENDVIFGRWFAENLHSWPLLARFTGGFFFGSLYNHGNARPLSSGERFLLVDPFITWGAQALVMTPATARFLAANWSKGQGNADVRMPRLASATTSIYLHAPSLVNHAGEPSTWGGPAHSAIDFDPDWRPGRKPYVPPAVRDA